MRPCVCLGALQALCMWSCTPCKRYFKLTPASTACLLCCSHGSTELYDEANRQQLAEEQAPQRSEESERLGP